MPSAELSLPDDVLAGASASAAVRHSRDVLPESCEARLIDETWQMLEQIEPARRAELIRVGESLSLERALQLALGDLPG